MPHDGGRDRRRELAMRAITALGGAGHIVIEEGIVRLPGADSG